MSAAIERVDWLTAPPLWSASADGRIDLDRPTLLRFSGDDFMDQFAQRVATPASAGDGLAGAVAAAETWSTPVVGLDAPSATATTPIKLFQPVHGRFYLVSAGLVCGRYGLPDKAVGPNEAVGFVLRRLAAVGAAAISTIDPLDPQTFVEYGFVSSGLGEGWTPVPSNGLIGGEERLPLFPTTTMQNGKRRRVFAGLVPASAAERYESAALVATTTTTATPGGAAAATSVDIGGSIENLVLGLQSLGRELPGISDASTRTRFRHALYFLLLDLGDLLATHPDMRSAVTTHTVLAGANSFRTGQSWLAAADAAATSYAVLEGLDPDSNPPDPVAGMTDAQMNSALTGAGVTVALGQAPAGPETEPLHVALTAAAGSVDAPDPPATERPPPGAHVYVARCVYERPNCRPTGRILVSRPSRSFELAGFHDVDAPARPVIIPTPTDVSVEGMRKFPKTVSIAISKQLRAQTDRVRGITVDNFDEDLPPGPAGSLGMICSLSIPIITICALILLMIMVQILNMVFFWLPYFQICRPEPEQ